MVYGPERRQAEGRETVQTPWMIYGANGYTGELIAREAVGRGLKPVLAGRTAAKMEALAASLGLRARVFDLANAAATSRGVEGMGLVLHCAGPFSATAAPMMAACLAVRAHYLDITGEISVFEHARTLEAAARVIGSKGLGRIGVGDASFEHGGDIPGHETHEMGMDIDIRPLRYSRDQCSGGTNWHYGTYDRNATRQLIRTIRATAPKHVMLIYFNDPVLIREGLTTWFAGHDDHLHVRYCEKTFPNAMYDC